MSTPGGQYCCGGAEPKADSYGGQKFQLQKQLVQHKYFMRQRPFVNKNESI